ncbi:MAG: hypothetical protein QM497_08710 [Sulfurimonas sp.]
MKKIILFLTLSSFIFLNTSADEYVIISNSSLQHLTKQQIKAIYLKKTTLIDDITLVPINLGYDNILREKFNKEILHMSTEQLKEYWTQQHLMGTRPPISMKSQESIKAFIKNVDGSIGYINRNNIDKNVSILYSWNDTAVYTEPYKYIAVQQEPYKPIAPTKYEYIYEPGNGYKIGSLPIYVGAHFSMDYTHKDGNNEYKINELAFFSYGKFGKIAYMAELGYNNVYVSNSQTFTEDKTLHIERLYVDYAYNDEYNFQLGKYNSPIGFWNLLTVDVLKETTSDPVSTSIIFPQYTTGLDVSYASYKNNNLKLDVMLQHNNDFDSDFNNYKVDKHYALGISYNENEYSVKVNGGYFNDLYYAQVGAKYETDKYEILGEIGHQTSKDTTTTPYAGYVQGSYKLTPQHVATLRAESYKNNLTSTDDTIAIAGYTYRPYHNIALKSEYQLHSKQKENQLLFSLSAIF